MICDSVFPDIDYLSAGSDFKLGATSSPFGKIQDDFFFWIWNITSDTCKVGSVLEIV